MISGLAMSSVELFSPAQVGAVAGVPLKAIYKTIEQRLPPGFVVRRNGQPLLTRWGAICVVIDHEIPKDVPVTVRRQVYAQIKRSPRSKAIESRRGMLRYVVDVRSVANKTDARLATYRKAMRLVVEDPAVQAGAATFKGTRILVHHIAALIAQGATEAELREDYPRLTRDMIAAAPIYARSHPRRGRPRKPSWRNDRQRSRRTYTRRAV
jgi:uncharacterized protein (DUF433 family)